MAGDVCVCVFKSVCVCTVCLYLMCVADEANSHCLKVGYGFRSRGTSAVVLKLPFNPARLLTSVIYSSCHGYSAMMHCTCLYKGRGLLLYV